MAGKFISPFVSDETGGEGADDEGDLTIADALLFNDSLDEGVDPTALLDAVDLPSECAAAKPKSTSVLQKELNDSLNAEDLDETQLPDGGDLAQAAVETKAPKAVAPDSNKECSKLSPEVKLTSTEKKAKTSLNEKKVSSTESQVSKGAKVKPSFGKKKRVFTPPKVAKKDTVTTGQTENGKQAEKPSDQSSSNASGKSPSQNGIPEITADSTKQPATSITGSSVKVTSQKVSTTEEKRADKKMTKDEKKREKEQKEHERALKKQSLEQKKLEREKKKAELERQRNEKRLELERKKAEREQKKMEKELKKMEREQKKAEKQVKAGEKELLAKDKKSNDTSSSEESVKKDEVETYSEKVMADKSPSGKCESGVNMSEEAGEADNPAGPGEETIRVNIEEKENILPKEKQTCEDSTTAALSSVVSCNAEAKKQAKPPKKGGDHQKTSDTDDKEKENTPPNEAQSGDVAEQQKLAEDTSAVSSLINTKSKETGRDESKKQKEKKAKKFLPPKVKNDANIASKGVKKQRKEVNKTNRVKNSSGDGASKTMTQASKGKKRKASVYSDSDNEPDSKRSKAADHHSSVWVQCENASCKKWRRLEDCDDPAKVPGKWVCSMNSDPDRNSCSAEEEQWSDPGDSQEFVESPYVPGSLVWSKMDGYPWWPAMIEEDPNEETYYEMGYRDDPIPVKYHVVFFDTPVSRGWLSSLHTLPYTGHKDPNKDGNVSVPQKHKRSLTEGKKQANKALSLSVKERLEIFGFAKRFHGSKTDRRKRRAEDSPEAIPNQSKYRKTTGMGERKSARLMVSSEENTIPVVSLKPLQIQQPNSEVDNSRVKQGNDYSLLHQHEE